MSGVFDLFTILFQSDTDEATQDVKKLDHTVDELTQSVKKAEGGMVELGQKTEQAADQQNAFLNMAHSIAGIAAGYLSLATIMTAFKQSIDYADQLGEFADSIGENVEVVSALSDAVKLSGGDVNGFKSSITSLSRAMADFSAKGKSRVAPFFKELGINMTDSNGQTKKALDLLPELADAFERISKEKSLAIGQKIGLDTGTIQLLQRGRKEMDALIKRQIELGVVTQEQAAAAGEFNDAIDDTSHAFRSLYSQLLLDILPGFKTFMTVVQDIAIFMRQHSDAVVGFGIAFSVLGGAIALATVLASPLLSGLALIVGVVVAISTVFGLLYEDIKVFMEGGDSMIGSLLDKFPKLYGSAKDFRDRVVETFDDITRAIKGMWYVLTNLGDTFSTIGDGIGMLFKPLLDDLPDVSGMLKSGLEVLHHTKTPLGGMTSAAMGAGAMVGGGTTSVSVGKVEVNTQATDAEGISRDIGSQLGKHLRQTAASYDDAVAY